MKKITTHSFGSIKINNQEYTNDVIISPSKILEDNWWRKEGHELNLDDMEEVFEHNPDIFVIGTGHDGRVDIQSDVKLSLKNKDIELKADKTPAAVSMYNRLADQGKDVVGGFHLTC